MLPDLFFIESKFDSLCMWLSFHNYNDVHCLVAIYKCLTYWHLSASHVYAGVNKLTSIREQGKIQLY